MNFKRHKPKRWNYASCGYTSCKYDTTDAPSMNGVNRYSGVYWKKMGGRNASRYIRKTVKEYENVVDL